MILPMFHSLRALTDEQLMARISDKDDERAYDELYRRHARRLMGFFLRQLNHDEALAADFTQDTFLRVWANRQSYAPIALALEGEGSEKDRKRAPFSTWLFNIACNLCKNHFRHLSYEQAYEQEIALSGYGVEDNTFDIQLDRKAFGQALQSLLAELPPAPRLLFSLRFEEDLSIPQIAQIIGIPDGTVKSRLHTLTHYLKQRLITVKP